MKIGTRVDLCSRILKRELADEYLAEHFSPEDTTVYVGNDWTERHRIERLAEFKKPWRYEAPLCEPPYFTKKDMLAALRPEGIEPPRLYAMGFSHNNCGGFCVKAGLGHFANLLKQMPERYAFHEAKEQEFREFVGRDDIAILRRQRGPNRETTPLTLRELREEIQSGKQIDMFDIGGCGCFSDEPQADANRVEVADQGEGMEYFRQIEKTGREVVVTDRGRPVLKIVPYRGKAREARRALKGSVQRYDHPTEPVGIEDWESLR